MIRSLVFCMLVTLPVWRPASAMAGTLVGTKAIGADVGSGPRYNLFGIAGFYQAGHHRANVGLGVFLPVVTASYSYVIWGVGPYEIFLPMIELGYGSAGMDATCKRGFFEENRDCEIHAHDHGPFAQLTGEVWLTAPESNFGITFRTGIGSSLRANAGFKPRFMGHAGLGFATYLF